MAKAAPDIASLLGVPVTVTSGYRTPQHNALVGGVPNSAHLTDSARDFVPQGMSMADAAAKLKQSGGFTKVLNEGDHVHVSYNQQGQMAQPDTSDAQIIAALRGEAMPAPSAAPQAAGSEISDADIIKALRGAPAKPVVAPPVPPPAKDISLLERLNLIAHGQPVPKPGFGLIEDTTLKMPFAKDIASAGASGLDMLGAKLEGKPVPSFTSGYQSNMAQMQAQQKQYDIENPRLGRTGNVLSILGTGTPGPAAVQAGRMGLGALMEEGSKAGATIGGLFGVGTAPEDEKPDSLVRRLAQGGMGVGLGYTIGGALPVAAAVLTPFAKAAGGSIGAILRKAGVLATDYADIAANKLIQALNRDQVSASDVAKLLYGAPSSKPLTALDVAGTNTKRQARNLVTMPGQAGEQITSFLENRSEGQSSRVLADIKDHLSSNTDVYGVADDLMKERSAAAGPLYEAAQAADSTAPFESQYRKALVDATGAKGRIAKQIKAIEANSPGALASRGAAGSEVRAKYMALQDDLKAAEQARDTASTVFQKAKADGTANAPGATWSPRLQDFLDNPEVQSGLKSGLKLEKQDAITKKRPFKDKDYSIVGIDQNGDPVVGAVPTMKSLMVAKEALDARVAEMIDPITRRPTKAGLSLKGFRDEFVKELDTLNSRYAPAREAWSGPSQSHAVMRKGEDFLGSDVEEITRDMRGLSDSDKAFYRVGAARAIQERAKSAVDNADLSKRLFGNQNVREQIEAAFGKGAADEFGAAMGHESSMAKTNRFVLGGPNTANKLADAEDAHHELAQEMLHGGLAAGPKGAIVAPAMGALKRGITNLFTGVHPETANKLFEALTAQGQKGGDFYTKLGAKQAAQNTSVLRKQGIGRATNRLLTGAATYNSANPQQTPQ